MKKALLSIIAIAITHSSFAQWTTGTNINNTNTGNVSIGPTDFLQKFTIKSPGTQTGGSSTDYDFGITDGAGNQLQLLGLVNTASNYGLLQVIKGGVGPANLVLQTQGGNVGIGTTSPDAKLAVKGTIHTQEVKVDLQVPGPDYVFNDDYKLITLTEIKDYVTKNHHLPEIPSAAQMAKDGINLGDMNTRLLKKVEELTLYAIDQQKQMEQLKKDQGARIAALEVALAKLTNGK